MSSGEMKRLADDSEIYEMLNKIRRCEINPEMASFDILSSLAMAETAGSFLTGAEYLTKCPSASQLELIRSTSLDKAVLEQLDNPLVMLALRLRQEYDEGNIPLFDTLVEFSKTHPVKLEPDEYMKKFYENAHHFLPPLPDISDLELKDKIVNWNDLGEDLEYFVQLGRGKFQEVVTELLYIRFPDQNVIADITAHLFSPDAARTWAVLYQLPMSGKTPPAELFYSYLGAHHISSVLREEELQLQEVVSTLIQPMVMQYDQTKPLEFAKENLVKMSDKVFFKTIHSTAWDDNEYHLVHAYVGTETTCVLLGVGAASTVEDAQMAAATNATIKESQLTRLFNNLTELEKSELHHKPRATMNKHDQPQFRTYGQFDQHSQYQQKATAAGVSAYETTPSPAQNGYNASELAVKSSVSNNMGSVLNDDYKLLQNINFAEVILAPDIDDDAAIDMSSKEKLNHLLIEKRYSPAEYKTSKISNVEVMVLCFIEKKPLVRAISGNKKKAGQVCAQLILNYWDYFFTKLPPR
ncbi:hypothetical protein BON22_1635 [Cyberlindnera fabianii]|uniref:Uncharacterized protein n=1 Tax=Cyberlindnera fabianii TaxID=36022 RepID=A0A1V2LBB6_CYBFA|nr:hypothetical protein BON22_1635 [Cyberlindnera fabianii]